MSHIPGVSKHAEDQMAARHGYTPTREEWLAAVLSILDRRALLMSGEMLAGRQRWLVAIGPRQCRVVWAPDGATIITVLPADTPIINPRTARAKYAQQRGNVWGYRAEPRRAGNARFDVEAGE